MSAEVTLTEAEREKWDRDPDEWPHTPPFHVFRALMDEDDNTWWRAGSGHGLNAYDAAVERVEQAEALADELWRDGEAATRRRSYAQGVALREAATRLRAALRGD